jgi:hypothetical protein
MCLFLLWCCEKDATFVPTLTTDIPELERSIAESVASFTGDILTKAWEEIEHQTNMGLAHVESLQG